MPDHLKNLLGRAKRPFPPILNRSGAGAVLVVSNLFPDVIGPFPGLVALISAWVGLKLDIWRRNAPTAPRK